MICPSTAQSQLPKPDLRPVLCGRGFFINPIPRRDQTRKRLDALAPELFQAQFSEVMLTHEEGKQWVENWE